MAAPAGAVRACARGPSSRLSDSASIAVAASLSLASSSAPPTDRPTQHLLRFESSTTADFLGRGSSLSLSPPPPPSPSPTSSLMQASRPRLQGPSPSSYGGPSSGPASSQQQLYPSLPALSSSSAVGFASSAAASTSVRQQQQGEHEDPTYGPLERAAKVVSDRLGRDASLVGEVGEGLQGTPPLSIVPIVRMGHGDDWTPRTMGSRPCFLSSWSADDLAL
jgi:hypothetical protein